MLTARSALYKPPPGKQDSERGGDAQRHRREVRGQELQGAARAGHGQEVLGVFGLLRGGFLEERNRVRDNAGHREWDGRDAHLECGEADDDACGEEGEGDDKPEDAPH